MKNNKLSTLLRAAAAIPGIGLSLNANAQTAPEATTIRFQYANYHDYQGESLIKRMRVSSPSIWAEVPVSEKDVIEGSFVFDSMSGASPYYHNTLTGASGLGVEDTRREGDLKYTHYFERFSLGLGSSISDEDDYTSHSGTLEAKIWSEDKNTTLAVGVSYASDDISSSIDLEFSEHRKSTSYFAGLTQVINPRSIIQSNISYANADGYMSDPYKPLDNRPSSRDQYAWLTRYRLFFPELEGALHADYRIYRDSWGILSHMVELAWYQPVGEHWTIRPSVRYESQGRADFFTGVFPPESTERFITADQRMADFGAITTGLKVSRDLGSGFTADIKFDFLQQRPGLKLGSSSESSVIKPFYATLMTFGLAKKF